MPKADETLAGFPADGIAMNQIICGDVWDALRAMRESVGEGMFDAVIADPPYNIGKDFGNNSDRREMSDYLAWTHNWLGECLSLAKPGGQIFVYGFAEILAHIAVRFPIENQRWLAWHYTNKTVPSSKFWQRSHESILCLWKGARPKINVDAVRVPYGENYLKCAGKIRKDVECRYGRKGVKTIYNAHPNGALPRDVISIPALAGGAGFVERWFYCRTCRKVCAPKLLSVHRGHDIFKHPTQKPLRLAEILMRSAIADNQKGYVLIPFAGSGSECVMAQSLGVNFIGIEKNPEYVNLARGWMEATR